MLRSRWGLINLNAGWSFQRADVPFAEAPSFDDAAWPVLDLPHTWNALDGQDGPPPRGSLKCQEPSTGQ